MSVANELLVNFEKYAYKIAVFYNGTSITYGELGNKVKSVAAYFQVSGICGECIAIATGDGIAQVTAILGIILSGNYYVAITPDSAHFINENFPVAINYCIFLLGDAPLISTPYKAVYLNDLTASRYEPIDFSLRVDSNFCALITSGSSSTPKVIVHKHRTINEDIFRQIADNRIIHSDRLDLLFSFSFSASLSCIFPALVSGAGLFVYPVKQNGLNGIVDFWQTNAITYTTMPVSMFHAVCKVNNTFHELAGIRCVALGAEPLNKNTVELFRTKFAKGTLLKIAYASSETRTISQIVLCNDDSLEHYNGSLGKPVANKTVSIVSDGGEVLPPGSVGEVIVASTYIANAYAGDDVNTVAQFKVSNDVVTYSTGDLGYFNEQGELFYSGRKGGEDKINGVKVDLGLIEEAVNSLYDIEHAVVVIHINEPGKKAIVAFFTSAHEKLTVDYLNDGIARLLPEGFRPHFYVQLNAFPLTHTDKVDRRMLESMDFTPLAGHNEPVMSETNGIEQTIVAAFNDALNVSATGINSSFFSDLGGDSLTAMVVISGLEKSLNIKLPAYCVWAYPTPAKLAAYISSGLYSKRVHLVQVNEPSEAKRNLYFINRFRGGNDYRFIIDKLQPEFNLIHLLHESEKLETLEDASSLISELGDIIRGQNKHNDGIVLGLSFQGFLAQQIASVLPEIKDCIMLDTYNYFELSTYSQTRSKWSNCSVMLKNTLLSGDYQILRNFIAGRVKRKGNLKKTDAGPFRKNRKHLFWHDYYIKAFAEGKSKIPRNCLFFRATRDYVTHPTHGYNWQKYVGGSFKLVNVRCTHLEITAAEHSTLIAENILQLVK